MDQSAQQHYPVHDRATVNSYERCLILLDTFRALGRRRGPKGRRRDPVARENEQLRKENARLQQRLKQAEIILEIQKKASEILGIPLNRPEIGDDV